MSLEQESDEPTVSDTDSNPSGPAHFRIKPDDDRIDDLADGTDAPLDDPNEPDAEVSLDESDEVADEPALVRPQALHMKQPEPEHKNASPDETLVLTADDLRYLSELEAAQLAARETDGADEDSDEAVEGEGLGSEDADDIPVEGPGLSDYGTRQITRDELFDEYESMDGLLHEDAPEPLSQHGKIGVAVAVLSLIIVIVFEGYFLFGAKSCTPSQSGDESKTSSFLDVQPLKRDPNVDRS